MNKAECRILESLARHLLPYDSNGQRMNTSARPYLTFFIRAALAVRGIRYFEGAPPRKAL